MSRLCSSWSARLRASAPAAPPSFRRPCRARARFLAPWRPAAARRGRRLPCARGRLWLAGIAHLARRIRMRWPICSRSSSRAASPAAAAAPESLLPLAPACLARSSAAFLSASTRSASLSFSEARRRSASALFPPSFSRRSTSFAIRRCASASCCASSWSSPAARCRASGVPPRICCSRRRSCSAARPAFAAAHWDPDGGDRSPPIASARTRRASLRWTIRKTAPVDPGCAACRLADLTGSADPAGSRSRSDVPRMMRSAGPSHRAGVRALRPARAAPSARASASRADASVSSGDRPCACASSRCRWLRSSWRFARSRMRSSALSCCSR